MRRAAVLLLSLLALPVAALELKPYTASYTADWKQLPVSGSAERSLQAHADGSWQLSFEASMLLAGLTERSRLRVQGEQLQPLDYQFSRHGLGKAKQIEHRFDWEAKQVVGSDRGDAVRLPLNRGLDRKSVV